MVPKPIGDNAQKQPLTIALKNICRDYPAGGVVLRELLQNADDARASEVRFYLDEVNHPTHELIHPALARYQGPALLAYNNATFKEKDFRSLSQLGNSLKSEDGSTTGKFGRGFNSVYNWTDSPSIVSQERLLILDPHEEWSTGGPVYDFVEDARDSAIQNHMAAFQSVMDDCTQPLAGTVIRIPLRTHEQAQRSHICSEETTVADISEVLHKFATDFGDSGLLFMRNITKIALGSTTGLSVSIQVAPELDIMKDKRFINCALDNALEGLGSIFHHSFEVIIKRSFSQKRTQTCFSVHHTILEESPEEDMQKWAKDQKYTPWVAVAAQIPYSESFHGSLFTVLPLPIPINQPVFIHGQFALSPDRASFYSQDPASAKWNDWLVHGPIVAAWVKMLLHIARLHPTPSIYDWFPRYSNSPNDPLENLLDSLLETVSKDSLPLWWTDHGYVSAKEGFLNTGAKSEALRKALRESRVPVIYVPDELHQHVEHIFNDRVLDSKQLSMFLLNENSQISQWTLSTKKLVLNYLLSEPGFTDIGHLELFPFKDGTYRSIANYSAFVCRNQSEVSLFNRQEDHNIDIDKLSLATSSILHEWCSGSIGHRSISYRSASEFRVYFLEYVFKGVPREQDAVRLDSEHAEYISQAWLWIIAQDIDLSDIISDLWLIPLTNGQYRKIKPRWSASETFLAPHGRVGDFMNAFDVNYSSTVKPLVKTNQLSIPARERLETALGSVSSLHIRYGGKLVDFAQWLYQIKLVVDTAPDEEKNKLLEILTSCFQASSTQEDYQSISNDIGSLQIFKKVSWNEKAITHQATLNSAWTSIKASKFSIGVLDGIIPVPQLGQVQFLDATLPSPSYKLLSDLDLAPCLRTSEVVESHIIPKWHDLHETRCSFSWKERVARLIVSQYHSVSPSCRTKLRSLPVIPVARIDGELTSKFSIAEHLISISSPGMKDIFFDDEEIVPENSFFGKFNSILYAMGLKTFVTEDLVSDRARKFASGNYEIREIEKRSYSLLQSPCSWLSPRKRWSSLDFRHHSWLPVLDLNGILQLKPPSQCRPLRDRFLVSSQLPVFGTQVSSEWMGRLGWDDVLPKNILLGQLKYGLQERDREIVDTVLTYVVEKDQVSQLIVDLQTLPCILTSRGGRYSLASKAFCPPTTNAAGCEALYPFLGNVEEKFWHDHQTLLAQMAIKEKPSLQDLLDVQHVLESRIPLSESDTGVAVEILRLACQFQSASLPGLKILSKDGNFYPLHEVNYDDLGIVRPKDEVNLTHPNIPKRYAMKLGIEFLQSRLMKGKLEIEDIDDEDEFEQHEEVADRIADTLSRYSIESTFREYLANADDTAGTSRISWLLDERAHADKRLVDPQLKSFQGPALLVYNNGVFSDDDFKGFRDVGKGSKRDNKQAIGQYGRGSQTMYHWTDVPMLLTGKWFLILDPQQKVLPKNQIKGKRKPGVKIELSKLREACPDQLAPFKGLWEYALDLDNYPGTIFRFPLCPQSALSSLRVLETDINAAKVRELFETYFDEARISLLFLKRIRSIDFTVYGRPDPEWSIVKLESSDDDLMSFSGWTKCSITKNVPSGHRLAGVDKWWVVIEDLQVRTQHLPYSPRRVMKNVECGIAGLVSSTSNNDSPSIQFPQITRPRVFSTLPLLIPSDLPVYIHASFLLSGDRQSLVIDEQGLAPHGSSWNRYLLETALPGLYLSFLADIGPKVLERVFDFWPQDDPPLRSCTEKLCSSFWQQLPQSSRQFFPKYREPSETSQRQRPTLFSVDQSVFDFLPKRHSNPMAPLLLRLIENLVRSVPRNIATRLKAIPGVHTVDGQILRDRLKAAECKEVLEEQVAENPLVIGHILQLVVHSGDDVTDLDGCHILPLANGRIGRLRLLGSSPMMEAYYFVSKFEAELFYFAQELFISSLHESLVDIVSSKKFNLKKLEVCDVGKIMEKAPIRAAQVTPSNSEGDAWRGSFWAYWNKISVVDVSVPGPSIDVKDLPGVYRARYGNLSFYIDPGKLDELSAVVEPSCVEHQQLCDKFPKLWRFDQKFMPKEVKETENTFECSVSFFRFIDALNSFAIENSETLGVFVKKHLSPQDSEVLRRLLLYHANGGASVSQPPSPEFTRLKGNLRTLALWPTQASGETLISATTARIAEDRGLLVPWMKHFSQFIDANFTNDSRNRKCLELLSIQSISTESLISDHILPLPPLSSRENWCSYRKFINRAASLSNLSSIRNLLHQNKVAPDRNRCLHKVTELFDHEDEIFIAAFHGQESAKFLHSDVQGHRTFWLYIGLRNRTDGILKPLDFLQCLESFSSRQASSSPDDSLAADSAVVLSPLTTPNSSIRGFNSGHWNGISSKRVFPTRSDFVSQPDHRGFLMRGIALNRPLVALSQLVPYKYVAICWSQTPFPVHEPTAEVFAAVRGGSPPIEIVWKHLEYLAGMSQQLRLHQMADFLQDLHSTYLYLQDHVDECRSAFSSRCEKKLWLNIPTPPAEQAILTEVKSSWTEMGDLNSSISHDMGAVKAIKRSLMPYEPLLRGLGCASIVWPAANLPRSYPSHSTMTGVRTLRNDKKLLFDITFRSEGEEIQAHRLILAAISEKWAAQWNGSFPIEDVITYDTETDQDDFISYHALSTIIRYAYEEDIDWSEMEVSSSDDESARDNKLQKLLDIHKGADYWIIPHLASKVEHKLIDSFKLCVNIENVEGVRETAGYVRALEFEEMCKTFIENNRDMVDRVSGKG